MRLTWLSVDKPAPSQEMEGFVELCGRIGLRHELRGGPDHGLAVAALRRRWNALRGGALHACFDVVPARVEQFAEKYGLSGAPRSLRDLPLIHLHNRTPDPQWADWDMWVERFKFEGSHTQTGLHFSQFSSGLQAALAGQGLVLCGVTEAFNALREGRLVMPFGPELNCPTGYQYRLISLRTRSLTKLQQKFRNWVVETAEKFRDSIDSLLRRAA